MSQALENKIIIMLQQKLTSHQFHGNVLAMHGTQSNNSLRATKQTACKEES